MDFERDYNDDTAFDIAASCEQLDTKLRKELRAEARAYERPIQDGEVPAFKIDRAPRGEKYTFESPDVVAILYNHDLEFSGVAWFTAFPDSKVDWCISEQIRKLGGVRAMGAATMCEARKELDTLDTQIHRFAEHVFVVSDLAELDEKLSESIAKYVEFLRPAIDKLVDGFRYADANHMIASIREHVALLHSTIEKLRELTVGIIESPLQELEVDDDESLAP